MSHAEEYSHDFEEVSGSGSASADTSQFVQSEDFEVDEEVDECLSDEENLENKNVLKRPGQKVQNPIEDDGITDEASSSKSVATLEEVQKFFENVGDDAENAPTPDMDEIESIMRKLDKLEKAQSMLETTLNLDWVDNNPEFIESVQHVHPNTSTKKMENISEAIAAELNSVEKLIKMESKSLEMYKRSAQNSTADSIASGGAGDRSLEDVLKEYNELEQSVSADIDDAVKPIPTDPLTSHSSRRTISGQRKTGDGNSSTNSPNPKTSQVNSKTDKKVRPKSAGKNQIRSQNFTEKFNELVNSELLKESADFLAGSSQYPATKSQSYDTKNEMDPLKYDPRSIYGSTESKPRKKLSASRNRRPGSASGENSESSKMQFPPSKAGAGEGILLLDEIIASSPDIGAGSNSYVIEKLKTEMSRQEALIDAYQADSQKLYSQLKNSQEEWTKDKERYEGEINSLKTEVATLKVNRLAQSSSNSSPLFGAGNKVELDRLKDESASKSELITDLRREILVLRNSQATRPVSAKKSKAVALSEEKENEYQKTIRNLNKQVRTLQKILYSKDPAAAAALLSHESKEGKGDTQADSHGPFERKNSQVPVLESRVSQLEKELAKADSEAKEKLKDFQHKLSGIKNKYEDRIKELEQKLEEANVKIYEKVSNSTTLELNSRVEKGQVEINHLKSEIIRYKRELEIANKSTANSSAATTKQDSATLSLAIKSFKSELADKEKEILKLRKETADLKRTNNNLKREREKYLVQTNANSAGNANSANPKVLTRAKTDLGLKPGRLSNVKGVQKKPNSAPKVASDAVQILQNALDRERQEFEKLIEEKTHQIAEQEKQIIELTSKFKAKRVEFLGNENREVDLDLMDDLRERVLTQNKVIIAMKEHIASFKSMEEEFANWRQDKERLEYRNMELARKCAAAEEFRKPEHEILLSLSQKVDDLDSRYHYREKQLDSLLNRLSVRTGGSASLAAVLSPRLTMLNGSVGNHHSRKTDIDVDLHQLSLSPTPNFHLLSGTNLV